MSKKKPKEESNSGNNRFPRFSTQFKEDLGWWYKTDVGKASKVLELVSEVMREPFVGIGKPEPLKYMEANTWSRRIDQEHRLVYRVLQERIDFLSCRYHYQP